MNAEDLRNESREARGNGSSHANDSLSQRGKRIISAREFIASFEPPDLTVPRLNIRKRAVYTMTGRTGDGKTGIVLCLTLCKAAGWDLAGEAVPQGRVLILAGENPEDPLMRLIL